MKRIIVIALLFLAACSTLFPKEKEKALEYPSEITQWAVSAKASSAYGGLYGENRDDQSPFAATGSPDVDECADSQKAWVINQENDGIHWLELKYDDSVHVSKVRVRETLGSGAVIKIELLDGNNYFTLWEGTDTNTACPGFFEIKYERQEGNITKTMTPFKTDTVKITLDTDVEDWNEIDAVELIGYQEAWYLFNNSIKYE